MEEADKGCISGYHYCNNRFLKNTYAIYSLLESYLFNSCSWQWNCEMMLTAYSTQHHPQQLIQLNLYSQQRRWQKHATAKWN